MSYFFYGENERDESTATVGVTGRTFETICALHGQRPGTPTRGERANH